MLALLASSKTTKDWPSAVKTFCASGAAATWRIFLMPVDTLKTSLQVNGASGSPNLAKNEDRRPTRPLPRCWSCLCSHLCRPFPVVCHVQFPPGKNPKPAEDKTFQKFGRTAMIGFCSSAVSDTCSNSIRVLKTTRQTYERPIGYVEAAKEIISKEGLGGLFGRAQDQNLGQWRAGHAVHCPVARLHGNLG